MTGLHCLTIPLSNKSFNNSRSSLFSHSGHDFIGGGNTWCGFDSKSILYPFNQARTVACSQIVLQFLMKCWSRPARLTLFVSNGGSCSSSTIDTSSSTCCHTSDGGFRQSPVTNSAAASGSDCYFCCCGNCCCCSAVSVHPPPSSSSSLGRAGLSRFFIAVGSWSVRCLISAHLTLCKLLLLLLVVVVEDVSHVPTAVVQESHNCQRLVRYSSLYAQLHRPDDC